MACERGLKAHEVNGEFSPAMVQYISKRIQVSPSSFVLFVGCSLGGESELHVHQLPQDRLQTPLGPHGRQLFEGLLVLKAV